MRLSSKLNRGIIFILILVILASVFTSIFLFNKSLESFVKIQRGQLFNQISHDIERFYKDGNFTPLILENYAKSEKLLIQLYTKNGILISEFNGLNYAYSDNENKFVTIKIDLLDTNNNKIGELNIKYIDDIYEFDSGIKNFQYEIIRNFSLIFLLSIIVASIFVLFFSKRITDPIMEIKANTYKLRQKNYEIENKNYNIYEIDQLSSDIDYLAKTLQIQDRLRLDYARDIAHELRTPLTNLLLHLEGIQDEIIEADEKTIELLVSETKRLNKMIDSLATSFNNNEKMLELDLEEIEIETLINTVTDSFLPLLKENDIQLNLVFDEKSIINTDKNKLTQILSNLISNAIKAIEKDGIIEIRHKKFNNKDIISVKDNGIGISKENIEHIFERFYRVDNVRNTKISGHGLGLSITKTFIDLLGYNIAVNSKENIGSEFIITIPR